MAAGRFAPGHLGELTAVVPFALVDAVLEKTRSIQRRLRDLPSRVDAHPWSPPCTAIGRSRCACLAYALSVAALTFSLCRTPRLLSSWSRLVYSPQVAALPMPRTAPVALPRRLCRSPSTAPRRT
ncbi:transposase domain-containing protein [Streptomyces sp. NPDC127532]|uniref:transposase domain-containing protein n=1 Tax=Streptomyces sp. NPDC127532 TaxID=3345399 RepID=UPI00362C69E8